MKPFLGIDITEDKKNEIYNGEEFIVAKPSEALAQARDKASDEAFDLVFEKAKLPLIWRIAEWVCGIAGLLSVRALVELWSEEDISFGEMYGSAPWLFWATGGCLILWVVLLVLGYKKQKETLDSDEGQNTLSRIDDVTKAIFAEMRVPAETEELEVLSFRYKMKDGEPVAKETIDEYFTNVTYHAYPEGGNLCLANAEEKYEIPLSALRRIRTVKKRIYIPIWQKDEEYNKGIYKPYKMQEDKEGNIHFKPYHILEFEDKGALWGIYFPCYELPTVERLTGLTAEAAE